MLEIPWGFQMDFWSGSKKATVSGLPREIQTVQLSVPSWETSY